MLRFNRTKQMGIKGIIVIIVSISVVHFIGFLQHREGNEQLARLKCLSTCQIQKICIYDDQFRDKGYLIINEWVLLDEFRHAINSLEEWKPNHPILESCLDVALILKNGNQFEFSMCFKNPPDDVVYISGQKKHFVGYSSLYDAKSRLLYKWFKKIKFVEDDDE